MFYGLMMFRTNHGRSAVVLSADVALGATGSFALAQVAFAAGPGNGLALALFNMAQWR